MTARAARAGLAVEERERAIPTPARGQSDGAGLNLFFRASAATRRNCAGCSLW